MPLAAGARLGVYEVIELIGAGGMGEVYRARDGTLNRDVALKILPEVFALDPDRLARFRREAQVLAALNHSNIASIYGFEGSGAVQVLVLESSTDPPSRIESRKVRFHSTKRSRWRRRLRSRSKRRINSGSFTGT